MNGKNLRGPLSALCVGVLVLVAGAAWALPGDLAGASEEALQAAIGGCALNVCHYGSACSNTSDGGLTNIKSTYFYYKLGSAANAVEDGLPGSCREHRHYTDFDCFGTPVPNTRYFNVCTP